MNRALLVLCLLVPHAHADQPPRREGTNGHLFVIVPSGSYALGSSRSSRNPLHQAKVPSYAIATTETTNAQFAAFVKATGYVTDAEKNGHGKVALEGMRDWAWEL